MSTESIHLLKFLICIAVVVSIDAYKEIKAYRLIQYETDTGLYGSQYASLNYIGGHHTSDVLRKIALIKLSEINSLEMLKRMLQSNANALLIIIPKGASSRFDSFILQAQSYLGIIY